MQFSAAYLVAALAAVAQAIQFDFGSSTFDPVVGEPVTLSWSGATGPVTITLKNGASSDLQTVEVIFTGEESADGTGTFTWTPSDLTSDTYALEITDGTDTNYSPQFVLAGDVTATTSAPSSTETESATETETETESTTEAETTTSMTNTTMITTTTSTSSSETSSTASATSDSSDSEETDVVNTNGSGRFGVSVALAAGAVALLALLN